VAVTEKKEECSYSKESSWRYMRSWIVATGSSRITRKEAIVVNKRIVVVMVLGLVAFIQPAGAQPQSAQSVVSDPTMGTEGFINGRAWEKIDLQAQITYLAGVQEGAMFLVNREPSAHPEEFTWVLNNLWAGLTAEIAPQITAFYKDRSNIRVPVVYAFTYVAKKVKGASRKELDDYSAMLRRKFNN
jgi:hypothetical protein